MATSGTTSFTVTRDDIIGAALRVCHVYGPADAIPSADITYCAQALNIMVKNWASKGMMIWCVPPDISLPTVAGVSTYQIGPTATGSGALVTDRPMRIIQAYIRDQNGNDTTLYKEARYDYNILGNKSSAGVPNQFYYDPLLGNGTITLYNVPQDNLSTIYLTIQRQVQDFNLSTDNPDFTQEWYHSLKWGLAAEIAPEYEVPLQKIQYLENKAKASFDDVLNWSQEDAAITFSPDNRWRG